MEKAKAQSILKGRYALDRQLHHDMVSQTWIGSDKDCVTYLIRMWPYKTEEPDESSRALWNSELRVLYRLCSSRKAEESILTIRDAGIDKDQRFFVMVLESKGAGYEVLSKGLSNRQRHNFLMLSNLKILAVRAQIWDALKRLAEGINSLHTQHVIHRNIAAETVYCNPETGPDSWRLGGFEWSLRLGFGGVGGNEKLLAWTLPPEASSGRAAYSFDTDWYAFGMLIARLFSSVEGLADLPPEAIHSRVREEIEHNGNLPVTPIEREFVLQLIGSSKGDRLIYGKEIVSSMERIQRALVSGIVEENVTQPLILAFDQKGNQELVDAAVRAGFQPDGSMPRAVYNPLDFGHVSALKEFLRKDLESGRVCGTDLAERWILAGRDLTLRIAPYVDHTKEDQNSTWDIAFLVGPTELRGAADGLSRDLGSVQVLPLPRREALNHREHQSWSRFLPKGQVTRAQVMELGKLHEFFRCTNQLELLMSAAKIFPYKVADRPNKNDGWDRLLIQELPQDRKFPRFSQIQGGLARLLHDEVASRKPHCYEVLLTANDQLHVSGVEPEHWWEVERVGQPGDPIELRRRAGSGAPAAPDLGFIRTYGLNGQVRLIERRKRAIDQIEHHAYLLSALATPGMLSMDTESPTRAFNLPPEKVDESKKAVIEDIERVRPIYTLQGPPGTGKTTLVAYLLRRIFADDPVAQVLVTAQAHPAVDVLRKKVREDSFSDVRESERPLGIRLGSRQDAEDEDDDDSTERVTVRLLEETRKQLLSASNRTPLQEKWLALVTSKLGAPSTSGTDRFLADVQQLVKRSAGITYCTTSARDLEDLAKGSETFDWSFDWSIVEEAGRVHGFDLALPLQAGHRWLLLGDQDQLDPFQIDAFERGLNDLDEAAAALDALDERRFLDADWIRDWQDRSSEEKEVFKDYARNWLRTFGRLFASLENLHGTRRVTETLACGASAGVLTQQWRMHPTIGTLISETFYKRALRNKTVESDGTLKPHVVHDYSLGSSGAHVSIAGKAIIWIDLPWCQLDPNCEEVGQAQGRLNYTNPREVSAVQKFLGSLRRSDVDGPVNTIAVLSPYTQQVARLDKVLSETVPPKGFKLAGAPSASPQITHQKWAHTVDSFQGNQADLVVASLVRNNSRLERDGLGFLKEHRRINVQFSRAERLLVIVGSWQFFCKQVEHVELQNELDELWFWKRLLSTLEEYFENGKAIRILERDLKNIR